MASNVRVNDLAALGQATVTGNLNTNAALKLAATSTTPAGVGLHSPAANILALVTGGAERVRIDASGSLGINTTDIEAWDANLRVLQLGGMASAAYPIGTGESYGFHISRNAYFDGAWKYRTASTATDYTQLNGTHRFRVATAGALADDPITWIEALTINSAGLLIPNLPTTKPATVGALWNNGGVVNVA